MLTFPDLPLCGRRKTLVDATVARSSCFAPDAEDIPSARRAQIDAVVGQEVQEFVPTQAQPSTSWNPALVYHGRQVTKRDRIEESVKNFFCICTELPIAT